MGLESGTTVASLNADWPLGTDKVNRGDDHLRLVKGVIKNDVLSLSAGGTVAGLVAFDAGLSVAAGQTLDCDGSADIAGPLDVAGSATLIDLYVAGPATLAGDVTTNADWEIDNGAGEGLALSNADNRVYGRALGANRIGWDVSGLKIYSAGTTGSGSNLHLDVNDATVRRSVSARRYKVDVQLLSEATLDAAEQLRAVDFRSLCDGDDPTKRYVGVVAEEAEALGLGALVERGPGGVVEGFDYSRLAAVVLALVHRRRDEVERLARRVEELEARG